MTADITFHYPPELFNLLVDTVPVLNRSKKDVLLFFCWGRASVSRPGAAFVVGLVGVVDRVNETLANRAADHLLAWPRHYDLDAVLVLAIKSLIAAKRKAGCAFEVLHAASVAHLEARIAEPLEAPTDWVRPNRIDCQCAHCTELSRFLADATSAIWTLRAAERMRRHVEDEIRHALEPMSIRTLSDAARPTHWFAPRTERATSAASHCASKIWQTSRSWKDCTGETSGVANDACAYAHRSAQSICQQCRCFGQCIRTVGIGNWQGSISGVQDPVPWVEYRYAGGNEFAGIAADDDEIHQRCQCGDQQIRLGKRMSLLPTGFQHQTPSQQCILRDG